MARAAARAYDLVVIGAGSGGVATAKRAAELGARVAIVEKGRLGGACVNLGCVPKKVMYYGAQVMHALHDAPGYGIHAQVTSIDWAELRARREAYIGRCNEQYAAALARARIDLVQGAAAFENANTVAVAGGPRLTAPHIVVATGGAPVVPGIPGAAHGLDSDGFFALDTLPKKAAVVGGGYIAVELAGVLQAYGTEVHLVLRTAEILRSFDADIRTQLLAELAAGPRGMKVHVDSGLVSVERSAADGTRTLTLAQPGGRTAQLAGLDAVLYAIGRSPLTKSLNLAAAGVAVDRGGYIPVDERQASNVPGIYAVGDVCGKIQLTPTAIAAGRKLAHRLFEPGYTATQSYDDVPSVVFSHPPAGTCGLTEEDAVAKFGADKIKIYKTRFVNMFHSMTDRKPVTVMKLVCTLPEERVVGVHLVGMGSDEILQGFAVAMRMGATKADLDRCVPIHPTISEEMLFASQPAGYTPKKA